MRKLVSIQRIWDILPIEGADKIELAKVLGWSCVVDKGIFFPGDLAVYFEVDSFLPLGDERWAFLEKSSYKKSDIMGEGLKIRTQKFRGQISQGLLLPLDLFPELAGAKLGDDVSTILGVRKWEEEEMAGSDGTRIGPKPFGIPTTDETRVQSDDSLRQQLLGKPYYITTKMDGTSCSMYYMDGQFGVCGRNFEYKDDDRSPMWRYAHGHEIPIKIKEWASCGNKTTGIVFQGEFCGPGVQKNRLQLKKPEWYVFNMLIPDDDGDYQLMPYEIMEQTCRLLGLNVVPLEEEGDDFKYSLEELVEKAKGKYPSGQQREGIVVRARYPEKEYCESLKKPLSFKVLNNDFLVKEK